jgi:general secretion pathway protein M
VNRLSIWFSELSPRERRLAGGFGFMFVATLLFLVPFGVDAMLRTRRDQNRELRDAVHSVQAARGRVAARRARRDEIASRYAKKAPKLAGFLEQLAKDQKIDIPEAQDKPELPIGKRYVERGTTVRLRRVNGFPLMKLLERIEQSGYPVAISRLSLRKRSGEKDSYDIELGVSAYDRSDAPATAAPSPSGSAGGR